MEKEALFPPELDHHLQSCASCIGYWNSLGAVRSAYASDPLYSPFLRAKTLRRMAERDQAFKIGWMPLVVVAALFSMAFSFVLPVWLLTKLFMYWTTSTAVACGVALAILLALGILVTAISAISLMERGYIHFGDEVGMQNQTEHRQRPASTDFHRYIGFIGRIYGE